MKRRYVEEEEEAEEEEVVLEEEELRGMEEAIKEEKPDEDRDPEREAFWSKLSGGFPLPLLATAGTAAKKLAASATVISNTSAMFFPL